MGLKQIEMIDKQKSREKITNYALEKFKAFRNIILEFPTGLGKTYNAISLQASLGLPKTLICVAETAHKQVWTDEYRKHGFTHLLGNTKIICYQSLKKHVKESYDLVILDECHHVFTEARKHLFEKIKADRVIGLSATIDAIDKYDFKYMFGATFTFTITIDQAVKLGLFPQPVVNVVLLDLPKNVKNQFIEIKRGNANAALSVLCDINTMDKYVYNTKKYPNLMMKVKCSPQEKYNFYDAHIERLQEKIDEEGLGRYEKILMNYSIQRKRTLSESKTSELKKLIHSLKDKRLICFCGSIEQANEVGKDNVIHSKVKQSNRVLNEFNELKRNQIFAVGMLVEGVNLVDTQIAVVTQLDNIDRIFIQKLGRSVRHPKPIVYILVYRNTRDEDYLKKILKGIPAEYINYQIGVK